MSSIEFDPERATALGADEHGMARYIVAFLRRGPNQSHSDEEAAALQRAHLDNIHRLRAAGKLVLVGPFLDDGDLRGIYVFDVETVAEAEELTNTDPSIREGRLVMELRPWYGSAALRDLHRIHESIAKSPV